MPVAFNVYRNRHGLADLWRKRCMHTCPGVRARVPIQMGSGSDENEPDSNARAPILPWHPQRELQKKRKRLGGGRWKMKGGGRGVGDICQTTKTQITDDTSDNRPDVLGDGSAPRIILHASCATATIVVTALLFRERRQGFASGGIRRRRRHSISLSEPKRMRVKQTGAESNTRDHQSMVFQDTCFVLDARTGHVFRECACLCPFIIVIPKRYRGGEGLSM